MFKKSESQQFDLFESIEGFLSDRKQKIFSDPSCWHNTFYSDVTSRIDESIFSVLYSSKMGRCNAPIRVLLGMCILKDGNGWSDEQLFRHCRFDLQVIRALGYTNMKEDIPVEATYYSFRKAIKEYEQSTGIDLLDECFTKITSGQIESYKVSGEKVRMDSKLINSNIRRSTRLEMILETVRVFTTDKTINISLLSEVMDEQDYHLLKLLKKKTVSNITYSLDAKGEKALLHRLGFILKQLLSYFPKSRHYSVANQIYEDHYHLNQEDSNNNDNKEDAGLDQDQSSQLKDSKEVKSDSIQSIHDPDAAYRTKGKGASKQNITGYHANITETCGNDNTVNLILSVEVSRANVSESEFLFPSINASEKVLEQANPTGTNKIKQVTNDGGYDSVENREKMREANSPSWNMSKIKGRELVFEFSYDKEGKPIVQDAKTKELYQINYSEKLKKYVIIRPNKKARRYFTKQQIEDYIFLQKIMDGKTEEDKKLRPNVESAIHQTFHRLEKRKKIKYRGLLKCKTYVYFRAIWVNFSRILKQKLELSSFLIIFLLRVLTNNLICRNQIYPKSSKV